MHRVTMREIDAFNREHRERATSYVKVGLSLVFAPINSTPMSPSLEKGNKCFQSLAEARALHAQARVEIATGKTLEDLDGEVSFQPTSP